MSKSPLSGAFAESSATTKKKNKKNGAILLIAGIALTSSIGGVFAANSITINGGAAIEFGQGIASATSCDTGLTTKMTQLYVTGDTFRVNTVEVSGIDGSACSSTVLRVALIGADSAEIDSYSLAATSDTTRTWTVSSSPVISADAVRKVAVTTER
jgi:hypothetical protein